MMDLHSHCFEIEYICFGRDCLILQLNSIALHLVVYFGKVDDLFERECFSHYYPQKATRDCFFERSISIMCEPIFFQIGYFHFLAIRLFFSSVMSLFYGDLSTVFPGCLSNMYKRLIVMLGPTKVWFVQSM